jgi:hypothetical protein
MSHTALGTSFTSLNDLCDGLGHLDKLCGLPYGGAASISKLPPKPPPKKTNTLGLVASVQDSNGLPQYDFEMHQDAWVGAINLPEDHVKQLQQMLKCVQCRTNDHTLPSCPLMKNWIIKKKLRTDHNNEQDSQSRSVGSVNSVMASNDSHALETSLASDSNAAHLLTSISEESDDYSDDHFGNVEFDLLKGPNSLDVMTISGEVTPYSTLSIPLGSVCIVFSSQVSTDCHIRKVLFIIQSYC